MATLHPPVTFSHWTEPTQTSAEITTFALDTGADRHRMLSGRMCLAISAGVATVHLRPTAAEARALIAAIEWALEPAEVAA